MNDFAIVTDSSCGLPPDLVEKYEVTVMPVLLHWEGRFIRDGVDISAAEVYERLRADPSMVVTSAAPAPGDFLREFERLLESHSQVLSIHVAGSLSSVVEVAGQVANELAPDRITVVDSQAASMELGFAVLAAARAREAGATCGEAAEIARAVGENSRLYALLDTLKYVKSSGRLLGMGIKAGSSLKVRPLVLVAKGQVRLAGVVRTRGRGIEKILQWVERESRSLPVHASVVHADAPAEAQKLAAAVCSRINCVEMIVSEFTPTVGGHTGPGLLGVALCTDERLSSRAPRSE